MLTSEVEIEASLRDIVTAVAPTLRPGAMVGGPVFGASLLPVIASLPAPALYPSPLLLPASCLLLRPLRLHLLPHWCRPRPRLLLNALRLLCPLLLRLSLLLLNTLLWLGPLSMLRSLGRVFLLPALLPLILPTRSVTLSVGG